MVSKIRLLALAAALCTPAAAATSISPEAFHIAPDGNDAWSGRAMRHNPATGDGPFATLDGARRRLREVRAGMAEPRSILVFMAAGMYTVEEPVVFEPEDSGVPGAETRFQAMPGAEVTVSGGRAISGWRVEDGHWVADVPAARDGAWVFDNLWIDGVRRTPARTPNVHNGPLDLPSEDDWLHADMPADSAGLDPAPHKTHTKLTFREGDLAPWPSLGDAYFVVYHSWETSIHRVKGIDWAARTVEFTGPAVWNFGAWQRDQRYYVSHCREALDAPGEWYLDAQAGQLHYMPLRGEDPATTVAVAPAARQLIVFQGQPEAGRYVEHLEFRGIRFAHTNFPIKPEGHSDPQAAFSVDAAIEATGARHCRFEECSVAHTGNHGVWWRRGSSNNALVRCALTDLGAGGVRIGEGGSPATPGEAADGNAVEHCFIHDGGNVFRGAVGVWIGRSSNNRVRHNEICDFRYTGCSVGWSWGYAESSANHNVLEYNHIHHIGMGQLNDMGGIYTLGISPGTVLRGNAIHDVASHPRLYGGWGLYTDEGSSDILLEGNLVYNTRTGGFHQHYGRGNRVVNNIFAFSHGPQIVRSREEDHNSFVFERNIVYFDNGDLLGSTWKNGNYTLDRNLYWDASGAPLRFAGKTFDEWKAGGKDINSLNADPGFANPRAGDFTLAADSPALALGFGPIHPAKAGLDPASPLAARARAVVRGPVPLPKTEAP